MASNQLNIQPLVVTGVAAIPTPANGTGTIETVGIAIKGTGTLFKTELVKGSYLYKSASNELRIVTSVVSDTLAYMEVAFASPIGAGSTPSIIHKNKTNIKEYIFVVDAAAHGKMVNSAGTLVASLIKGQTTKIPKAGNDRSGNRDFLTPTIIDGTGTTIGVTIVN